MDVSGLDSGVAKINAGGDHTCALTEAGGVKCWGYNLWGALGDGTTTHPRSTPVDVSGLGSGVAQISGAMDHTCALTETGAVKCWGYNANGLLGDGTTTHPRTTPVDVSGLGSGVMALFDQYGNYDFAGFFAPVDNPPELNRSNAGRSVPIKFSLHGDYGLEIFAPGYPRVARVDCDSGVVLGEIEETVTAGKSDLQYATGSDQYIYVWKTAKAWHGTCRRFQLMLDDRTLHMADFVFK